MGRIINNEEKQWFGKTDVSDEIATIDIFDKKYNEMKEHILRELMKSLINFQKSKSLKTDSDLFSQAKSSGDNIVKKKKKIDKHFLKTTLNTMYDNYCTVNKKDENIINLEVLTNTKKIMMNTMLKFTNNLVYDDINNKPIVKKKKAKTVDKKKDKGVNSPPSKKVKLTELALKSKGNNCYMFLYVFLYVLLVLCVYICFY